MGVGLGGEAAAGRDVEIDGFEERLRRVDGGGRGDERVVRECRAGREGAHVVRSSRGVAKARMCVIQGGVERAPGREVDADGEAEHGGLRGRVEVLRSHAAGRARRVHLIGAKERRREEAEGRSGGKRRREEAEGRSGDGGVSGERRGGPMGRLCVCTCTQEGSRASAGAPPDAEPAEPYSVHERVEASWTTAVGSICNEGP